MKTGLFIGRFQPFHNAHLADVKLALQKCDHIIIGIGSANVSRTEKNPFTAQERKTMISAVLKEENIANYSFIEINDTESDTDWVDAVESQTDKIDVVYTGNDWTEECFQAKGYRINKITLIPGISATIIRGAIRGEQEWQNLVPKPITDFIIQHKQTIIESKNKKVIIFSTFL